MFNWPVILLTALIPMVIGFIYYHPKVLGTAWMSATKLSMEDMKGSNMAMIFIVTYIFSVLIAMFMPSIVIHQSHLYSIVQGQPNFMDPTSEAGMMVKGMMDKYGHEFRTFKHGMLHGFISSVFYVLPIIGTNALYERRGGKYIFINWGFWAIVLMLMGGSMCQFS